MKWREGCRATKKKASCKEAEDQIDTYCFRRNVPGRRPPLENGSAKAKQENTSSSKVSDIFTKSQNPARYISFLTSASTIIRFKLIIVCHTGQGEVIDRIFD